MNDSATVVHPAQPVRRNAARASTWWGKAWVRGLEEAAYDDRGLRRARSLSRSGGVGGLRISGGGVVGTVEDRSGMWTVAIVLPVLDPAAQEALIEVVAAESGRVSSLLSGDLPHSLVEHAEESGVELLPFGSELESSCNCDPWVDPCAHALAVMYQLTWLIEADPFVLLHLRGLPRQLLLARLHELGPMTSQCSEDSTEPDLDSAADAAWRARRILDLLERPGVDFDHLL